MDKHRRCKNCGAFLDHDEQVCYVCGEPVVPEVVAAPERNDEGRGSSMRFEKDEDFVMPVSSHSGSHTTPDNRLDYGDEDIAEPYYKSDEKYEKAKRRRGKKAVIIAVICVVVAGIIGAVCFCLFSGVFGGTKKIDNKLTIYFDKPNSEIALVKSDGTVFNWTGDVEVSYVLNGKTKTRICTPCSDHESLWRISLPSKANTIYFYEKDEKGLRTQVLPSFDDEMVYYVSQESLNAQNQLPIGQCPRDSFEGIGINYATTAPTSEETTAPATTEAETQEKTEETEASTEDDSRKTVDNGTYTVSLPKSWQSGVAVVESKNCTSYYEEYNYNMYNMGKLASIYVFDANDSAADNLTGVKDIRYNSDQTKKIVITTPTDIQFNEADEEAQKDYLEKNKDLNSFLDSISVE